MSGQMAAKLGALTPRFAALPPPPVLTNSLSEVDAPKNHIIRLPQYTVTETPLRIPAERATLTLRGRLDLAKRLHPGAGPSWLGNDGIALAMLKEDERLEDVAHYEALVKATSFQDPKAASAMKKTVDSAFMRDPQFKW